MNTNLHNRKFKSLTPQQIVQRVQKIKSKVLLKHTRLAFLGLNLPESAVEDEALWSRDKWFWEIKKEAGIYSGYEQDRLQHTYNCNKHNTEYAVTYLDLVYDNYSPSSANVHPTSADVQKSFKTLVDNNIEAVALLGQKVIEAYLNEFPSLKVNWKKAQDISIQSYGPKVGKGFINTVKSLSNSYLGQIVQGGKNLHVYAVPFPSGRNYYMHNITDCFTKMHEHIMGRQQINALQTP